MPTPKLASPADWCPDAAAQEAFALATPALVGTVTRPLLDADATLRLWKRGGRADLNAAAVACCADPDVLDDIASKSPSKRLLRILVEHPLAPLRTMWRIEGHAASMGDSTLATRAAYRAQELCARSTSTEAATEATLLLASRVENPARVASAVVTSLGAHISCDTTPEVAQALLDLPSPAGAHLANMLVTQFYEAPARTSDQEKVRQLLVERRADRVAASALTRLRTPGDMDAAVIADLLATLGELPRHEIPLAEITSVFSAVPQAAAGELLAAAFTTVSFRHLGEPLASRLADAASFETFPAATVAQLPATALTVARTLAERGADADAWALAMQLLPSDVASALASGTTAGAVVDQACVACA